MDAMELRQSTERFKQSLASGNHYRIVRVLHAVHQLNGELFVWVLYTQLFHREPLEHEFRYYIHALQQGTPKMSVISDLIQNEEAVHIYNLPHASGHQGISLAGIINQFYLTSGPEFVEALYYEFLYRGPDPEGYQIHLTHLNHGVPRMQFIMSFLASPEFQSLIAAPLPPGETSHSIAAPAVPQVQTVIYPVANQVKQIGIFMGYTQTIGKLLDGEGIGRFTMRLVEGLLAHQDVVIHIAVKENNYVDLERSYRKLKAAFEGRLAIHKFDTVDWLNQHIPADVWIVPYVGMELALQLQKPTILCVHDLVYMHFRNEYYREQPLFCQGLDNIVYKMADKAQKVVFNSNFTKDNEGLKFLQPPFHKMHVIRLAAPAQEYHSFGLNPEHSFREKYGIYGPYITFPSVVRLHKNHDRLIEAYLRFRQSPEGKALQCSLVLTDQLQDRPLESEMTSALLRCTDLEARGSVRYIGRLPSHDIPSLYKFAQGTIVPTLFEGSCPFPIMESLVMDTPVATSRLEVINEVVNDHYAFITFNPYSVEEMESAIRQLIYNGNSLLGRQKNAIHAMMQRQWSDVANEYYSIVSAIQQGY